jgi:AcrR family transcriptional regulator
MLKPDGRTRLLIAATDMLCRQPPSTITGRRLAKNSDVHHTFIGQSYGTVASLLAASYRFQRDRMISEITSLDAVAPFLLANHPLFWRPYTQFTLDPFQAEIAVEITRHNPVRLLADQMRKRNDGLNDGVKGANIDSLVAAWWAAQIGALVFEKPLAQGLGIGLHQRDAIHTLLTQRLSRFGSRSPLRLEPKKPPKHTKRELTAGPKKGREAAEWSLIDAAARLLYDRADAGISGRELARRAGVNYGLIHHYFGSKEAVFDQAFSHLHGLYLADVLVGSSAQLTPPFEVMINHQAFIHAWACRELADLAMPPVDLAGMRILLENTLRHRGVDKSSSLDFADVQADVLCAIAMQLGWAICRSNVAAVLVSSEKTILGYLVSAVDLLLRPN